MNKVRPTVSGSPVTAVVASRKVMPDEELLLVATVTPPPATPKARLFEMLQKAASRITGPLNVFARSKEKNT